MIVIPAGATADTHTLAAVFSLWSWLAPSGPRHIDAKLVSSWYERRRTTGFPKVATTRKTGPYRPVRVWDLYDALVWFLNWKPRPKGAPPGNHNALKHGRYAGRRGEQQERGKSS